MKVKISITTENGKTFTSEVDSNDIQIMKELHGMSLLDDAYDLLLNNIEKDNNGK